MYAQQTRIQPLLDSIVSQVVCGVVFRAAAATDTCTYHSCLWLSLTLAADCNSLCCIKQISVLQGSARTKLPRSTGDESAHQQEPILVQGSPHRPVRQKASSGSGGGSNPGIALTGAMHMSRAKSSIHLGASECASLEVHKLLPCA